ncbi:MAG TPA: PIG-L family deacetylase [Phycisphaerae bacterium]|nr:PIG-L family deacetylase [Phycisphaerales bacterium]HRX86546.1 PIG-L family deacetylase [Phycisphaerae bacterium]
MTDVLVVAAHPDDEVLGCGGTMARLAGEGCSVHVAILGEGITSRSERREQADRAALERLHGDARAVGELLGARGVSLFSLPDNRFDTVPLLEVVKIVEGLVAEHQPRTIYTHGARDLNVDHAVVHRAVLTATRPLAGGCVREIYAFEVASSTEWAFGRVAGAFAPNVFVDIGDTLERKCAAMARYESEARGFPHPRSREALEAIARRWGSVAGVGAAEAFELVRAIR